MSSLPDPIRRKTPAPDDAALELAQAVLSLVPALMRELRAEMRHAAPPGLSVPLFRALLFAQREPGGGVTALAAHLGVSVPTASVAVDKLARRGLLRVITGAIDRRQRQLHLSTEGRQIVQQAMRQATGVLQGRVSGATPAEQAQITRALHQLTLLIVPEPAQAAEPPSKP